MQEQVEKVCLRFRVKMFYNSVPYSGRGFAADDRAPRADGLGAAGGGGTAGGLPQLDRPPGLSVPANSRHAQVAALGISQALPCRQAIRGVDR